MPGQGEAVSGAQTQDAETLDAAIDREFARPAPGAVGAVVASLVETHGDAIAAILFYGSCRRSLDMTGLLDLTVLHDGHRAFHRRLATASFNALLPPTVMLACTLHDGLPVRAKIAVMSRRQFAARTRTGSLDTTVWARFCQPASLVYAREPDVGPWMRRTIADAIGTAALWAIRLGSPSATAGAYWTTLFEHTYGAELRPEPPARAAAIVGNDRPWFDLILAPALALRGFEPHVGADLRLHPGLRSGRGLWHGAWLMRRLFGKALNAARLVKAAFTFSGGADYIAWKIERHSGVKLELVEWQRRHPLLAAPSLILQLRRGMAAGKAAREKPGPGAHG